MKTPCLLPALLAAAMLPCVAPRVAAQRSPGPLGPPAHVVRMTSMRAQVRIVDGVSTTTLHQVLRNDGPRQEEAIWILPLPPGAAADQFEMVVGGQRMTGDVLSAGQARNVYESIVRQRRDPGLLEYMGRGCLRARIFPIPPQGEVEVEVVFRHVLPEMGGLIRWDFPLKAAGLEGRPPEQVVLDLAIDSRASIRNVFSPVGGIHVVQKDDHHAVASFEGALSHLPNSELAVFYGLSEKEFGLNLLSYRKDSEEEGSFLMLVSPKRGWEEQEIMKKEITFVLDTSGSMSGRKIEQAREALRFFLYSLRAEDRFNVIPFATEAMPFFPKPVPVTRETLDEALRMVRSVDAVGGTNIHDAMKQALGGPRDRDGHVPILVFLTDGQPTINETNPAKLQEAVRGWNGDQTRIFVFGVGSDVNTNLLDTIAADAGGTRDYVREHENIEEKTGALFAKLSHPVMRDLELTVDGMRVTRVVPSKLPDLFVGSRLEVVGRYLGDGPRAIRLTGMVGDVRREYVYEGTFAKGLVANHDFVPSLWAQRRVGVLLDEIRLNGQHQELLDEVCRLGVEYHIVTPYTSHLIVEEGLRVSTGTGGGRQYRGPGNTVPPGGARASGTSSGPASPGGPGSPGPGGPTTMGGGVGRRAAEEADLGEIAERLRGAGVLPRDASKEELERLAGDIAREMRDADGALGGLGYASSGETAVDDSVYLARLLRSSESSTGSDGFYLGRGKKDSKTSLLDLFTKKVKDRVFLLRDGVWTDRGLTEELAKAERTKVVAYSKEYFDLLVAQPALASYFAFSERLVLVFDGKVYEVQPAPPEEPEEAPPKATDEEKQDGTGTKKDAALQGSENG